MIVCVLLTVITPGTLQTCNSNVIFNHPECVLISFDNHLKQVGDQIFTIEVPGNEKFDFLQQKKLIQQQANNISSQ